MVDSSVMVENQLILNTVRTAGSYRSQGNEPAELLRQICFFTEQPGTAVAIVRLDLDNRLIGAFWIARFEAELYSDTDLIWLECLADQITIAVKHGLVTAQLQSLSVIEERTRIAREMHDGVAQVLGYLNLQVQTLEALLQQSKLDKLREKLAQMREAVKVAHADVRENILSLRTTLDNEKGLIPAIDEYLHEFGIQTTMDARFVNEVESEVDLSSIAEVQLVYILHEALSNVRKHSRASHVTVRLSKEGNAGEESIILQVWDDGMGFTSSESKRSFGLQTMRERARSVNGELLVHSVPGKGTQIKCSFPCLRPEKLAKRSLVFQ
jgi:nitrate/nitrite-specific signal transduction histidine kinase